VAAAPRTSPASVPKRSRRVLELFLGDAPARVEALRAALLAADGAALDRAAHKLRGGCLAIGADAPAALCARIEEAIELGSLEAARALVPDLAASVAALCVALAAELDPPPAAAPAGL